MFTELRELEEILRRTRRRRTPIGETDDVTTYLAGAAMGTAEAKRAIMEDLGSTGSFTTGMFQGVSLELIRAWSTTLCATFSRRGG